ncbi:MAG TPA: Clp protease N-terminal domain-containing protein [Mycobacteriales bacterium]|nr:Clp protease N-terminal domain-containing protein [Mycobacteriales bacterium]
MFERFTEDARQVVVRAQEEARRLHSDHIGTEHLLLGLLDQDSPTAAVLVRHGLTRESTVAAVRAFTGGEALDAAALGTVGIDLDAVRESVEATFGPGALDAPRGTRQPKGHIPFTPRAKKVLELSLREALALKSRSIADGHIALGLIREGEGLAMKVVHDRGIDAETLRQEIRTALAS